MKETGGAAAAAELPVGQKLIKVISNVCFTAFVFSVLVVTVIAVTYQPPDPWLQSAAALTKNLAATLPNATFATDESLLPTGEDLVSLPPNASLLSPTATAPPVASALAAAPPVASAPAPAAAAAVCDPDAPLNCSDPRVLAAIRRFNARVSFRRSIIFLGYETPVAGSKPDECDAAWRFRNRKEKSWRRYRDYRRFRLAPADNCTFEVIFTGKFRSGTNAARPRTRPPSSSSTTTTPTVQISDAEINDTIPTLGSESDFRKGRYLYYTRGGDYCKGMNHYLWSFLCGLGEAQFLNRTFVMDLSICLSASYNPSGRDEEGKDFRFYFDFEHLKESASVVEEGDFLRQWRWWG